MGTFKVLSVIRLRRHGGVFNPNREYPIKSAEQYGLLKDLAESGEVMLVLTDEERDALEAELAKSEKASKKAAKPAKKPAKATAKPSKKAKADASDDAEGTNDSEEEDDGKSDI